MLFCAAFDVNHNGVLTGSELFDGLGSLSIGGFSDSSRSEIFVFLDKDRSGMISESEFIRAFGGPKASYDDSKSDSGDEQDGQADEDGDGTTVSVGSKSCGEKSSDGGINSESDEDVEVDPTEQTSGSMCAAPHGTSHSRAR